MLKTVAVLVAVVLVGACGGSGSGAGLDPADLAGTWCDGEGAAWTFTPDADGTGGQLELADGAGVVARGTWALEGNRLTVWDGRLDPWDGEVSTRYAVRLEAGVLELDAGQGAVDLSPCGAAEP